MKREEDTGCWLVLAGFGLLGVGVAVAIRHLAPAADILAAYRIGGYETDPTWPRGVYADAALGVTLSGLLAGGLVLMLHRHFGREGAHWGRWLQLAAILLICAGLLGLAIWRCFG